VYTYNYPKNPSLYARRGRAIRSIGLAAATAFGAIAGSLPASTILPVPFQERVSRAEVIVEAVVQSIAYKNSSVIEPGDREIPHTFVTFAIEQIVKGEYAGGQTITLRFIGGQDGKGNTTYVPGLPSFQVGDREILFVRKNGKSICPLIGWGQGRLRIVRGQVFDDTGFQVWISPDGQLVRGDQRVDTKMFGHPSLAAPKGTKEGSAPRFAPPEGSFLPDREGMIAVIRQIAKQQAMTESAPKASVAKNADISRSFRGPAFARSKVRPPKGEPSAPNKR